MFCFRCLLHIQSINSQTRLPASEVVGYVYRKRTAIKADIELLVYFVAPGNLNLNNLVQYAGNMQIRFIIYPLTLTALCRYFLAKTCSSKV